MVDDGTLRFCLDPETPVYVGRVAAAAKFPNTIAAYCSQHKRWTQGWAQLQRVHMKTLLLRHAPAIAAFDAALALDPANRKAASKSKAGQ